MLGQTLEAGHCRRCITPGQPMPMLGYASRTEPFVSVHDDLYCDAVALQENDDRALLITLDLCWMDMPEVEVINEAIQKETELGREQLLICFSHTHAGPLVARFEGVEPDQAYIQQVIQHCVQAAMAALDDLQPATLVVAETTVDIGCNRREKTAEGRIILGVNPKGAHLDAVTCWCLQRPVGEDILLFSHPMHGTSLGAENMGISAEWMGVARREIEALKPGTRAVYVQGCGADQNPYREERTLERMQEHGATVARAIRGISNWEPVLSAPLRVSRTLMALPTRDGGTAPCPLHGLRLGDCVLLGLGGEAFVEYALYMRAHLAPPVRIIVAGYCDGSVGYLPTAAAYGEGGYEPESWRMFSMNKSWSPDLEEAIKREMDDVLAWLQRE